MKTRAELIEYCLTMPYAYEDYPFGEEWTVMRRHDTTHGFAFIFRRDGNLWVNVKCHPDDTPAWCHAFDAIVPAYHMNKTHWISLIMDGTLPDDLVKSLIETSWQLCGKSRPAKRL